MRELRIGTSGWLYPEWRGAFYPRGLRHADELSYLTEKLNSVEINGSFYSLQRPSRYRAWAAQTPEDFTFAVKGGRFITHMKRLADVDTPLANFFASGVLTLGPKLGPVLWQLPPQMQFDADRLDAFLRLLPHTTGAAAELAKHHDDRLPEAYTEVETDRPIRHALEVRHKTFRTPEYAELLRTHDVANVVADSAGVWPQFEDVTTDLVYVRLHGDTELYASGYSEEALQRWTRKIRAWRKRADVCVYFDNDMHAHAPRDAMALKALAARGNPLPRRRK